MSAPRLINPPPASGGVPVGGSGTTGTLPIWVAPSTLGNSATVQTTGTIAAISIVNGGSGATPAIRSYQQALPTVTGSGTGAQGLLRVAGGSVTQVSILQGGSGFAVGDTLTVTNVGGGSGYLFRVDAIVPRQTSTAETVSTHKIAAGQSEAPYRISANGTIYSGAPELVNWFAPQTSPTGFWNNGSLAYVNHLASSRDAGPNGAFIIPLPTTQYYGIVSSVSIDTSLQTGSPQLVGYYAFNTIDVVGNTTSTAATCFIGRPNARFNESNKTFRMAGSDIAMAVQNDGVATTGNVMSSALGYLAQFSFFQTAASGAFTCTLLTHFEASQSHLTTAGSIAENVITTVYGVRVRNPTYAGTRNTNRYWHSQEARDGQNYFRAKTFIGPATGTAPTTAASVEVTATNVITAGSITNAGAAYTDGNYVAQTLTGGAPIAAATANLTVAGGVVTSVRLIQGGEGYAVGNVLSCALPGGAGFQWTVTTIQGNGDVRINTAGAAFDASASSTNGVRFFNRAGAGQTSNTLAWYEEGTYTPTITNYTLGACTATWVRVGRKVFVTLNFAAGTNNGSTVAGASSISLPVGLAAARSGLGLRAQPNGTASGNGIVAVDAGTGQIQISTTVTLDTNAKVIQCEYEV